MTQDEIKEALETCILGYCTGCPYDGCDGDCRDELHKDVLALITEQEKEIERLKVKCEEQESEIDKLEGAVKENDERCFDCPQVKQAKIDVLNELKKYLHTEDFDTPDERWKPESEFCAIIDKIIKEVQNAEDKG